MKVEYDFAVPSQIYLNGVNWVPIVFERGQLVVTVHEPKPLLTFGPQGFMDDPNVNPGPVLRLAVSTFLTRVTISLESKGEVPLERFPDVFYPAAYETLNLFKSWVRVLTRQYWIGYKFGPLNQEVHLVFVVNGEKRSMVSPPKTATGLSFWRPVTNETWEELTAKLRVGLKPRLGQILFCDGLFELLEFNLPGSTALMGIACELEVNRFLRDLRQARKAKNASGRRPGGRFRTVINKIENLCNAPFSPDSLETLDHLDKLFDMRGEAVHTSSIGIEDGSRVPIANAVQLLPYAEAVEKLFGWLDVQRAKLLQSSTARGDG